MKYLVAMAVLVGMAGLSMPTQAQTYGGFYGGYGDNGFLNRALTLKHSKRKAHSTKRVSRKKIARRSHRSSRRSHR